jgi:RNA polymerase sigma-70 factor, ECF subfamily
MRAAAPISDARSRADAFGCGIPGNRGGSRSVLRGAGGSFFPSRMDTTMTQGRGAGDEFDLLLGSVLDRAYGTALRLSGNREDAEDLVQEAALRAFRGFPSFTPGTNFRAWFFRILVNCFYGSCRKRRPEDSLSELDDSHQLLLYTRSHAAGLISAGSDPVRATLDRVAEEDVGRALEALPEEFRVVATLYFMDDLSYQEIAGAVGVPVGTVRSRLHRARRILQKRLWSLAHDAGITAALIPD